MKESCFPRSSCPLILLPIILPPSFCQYLLYNSQTPWIGIWTSLPAGDNMLACSARASRRHSVSEFASVGRTEI